MEPDTALAVRAVELTRAADDLDGALDALVRTLRTPFDLWFACLASHPIAAPEVTILAAWSMAENIFEVGTGISSTISPLVITVLDTLHEGAAITFPLGGDPDSLVEHLFRAQGVVAAIALPIHRDERALLLLMFGSSSESAFRDVEHGFFARVVAGIRPVILRLAAANT